MLKKLQFLLPILALMAINLVYFFPVTQGKVLSQSDIQQGKGTGHNLREYRAEHNEEALWSPAMFSGMPAFQISVVYANNWVAYLQKGISTIGGKPSGIYIVFSLMLGFYVLLSGYKVNPWLAVVGAVAFAFSAFFIISYGAGHNAKVRTAAYIAPIILSVLLAYREKYVPAFLIAMLGVGLSIQSNHIQITYYMAIIIFAIAVVEFVFALREKQLSRFVKGSATLLVAAILGLGPNIGKLWTTYEYTKETNRGGSSELSSMEESKGGLTLDYAMAWSYGVSETFNLIFPNFSGGGSEQSYEGTEMHDQYHRNFVSSLSQQGYPRAQAEKQADRYISSMFYWGDQGMVHGGYYLGAVVFFLFVFGFFVVESRIKWWVGVTCVLAIFMAWGKNFLGFNEILFNHLPLYNKFRVPSMAFIILILNIPFLGFLAANQIISGNYDKADIKKKLLKALYVSGGLCLLIALLGSSLFTMEGVNDSKLAQQGMDLDILGSDRITLMRNSALRTLVFCGLTFGTLWLVIGGKLKPMMAIGALALLVLVDQWSFDKQHLSSEDFVSDRMYNAAFNPSPADQTILQDKDPHYRVLNTTAGFTGDAFTPYFHKSLGGYHAAKLIRYQDLIDHQLDKNSMSCFNMLNAKWVISANKQGQKFAQQNPNACGNSWFVQNIQWAANADAEMEALSTFEPKSTVVIDERFREKVPANLNSNPSSTITLSSFDHKHLTYQVNVQSEEEFAVFSEVYYEGGDHDWKAYIDGKPAEHIRVNYLLRGMTLPKGQYTVEFKFEPHSYFAGEKISLAFSILMVLALAGGLFWMWKNKETENVETKEAA